MREYLRLFGVTDSLLWTKRGIFQRTGQNFGGIKRSQVTLIFLPLGTSFAWGATGHCNILLLLGSALAYSV